jgi:hypothetical protein
VPPLAQEARLYAESRVLLVLEPLGGPRPTTYLRSRRVAEMLRGLAVAKRPDYPDVRDAFSAAGPASVSEK